MAIYEAAPDLKETARLLAAKYDQVCHVEVNEVLFLRELETSPRALAKCYSFGDSPICFFTDVPFAIVVYDSKTDYMSPEQLTMLVLHEMMHIPTTGAKLVDHDVEDFHALLSINLDWAKKGAEVPDLLEGENGRD